MNLKKIREAKWFKVVDTILTFWPWVWVVFVFVALSINPDFKPFREIGDVLIEGGSAVAGGILLLFVSVLIGIIYLKDRKINRLTHELCNSKQTDGAPHADSSC